MKIVCLVRQSSIYHSDDSLPQDLPFSDDCQALAMDGDFEQATYPFDSSGMCDETMSPDDTSVDLFICKHNGVLFENDVIQIGVKSEYREHLGRVGLFYGNKTPSQLLDFRTSISLPSETEGKINIAVGKEAPSIVEGGAQVQQMVNIECLSDFAECPIITISYQSGSQQTIRLKLPVLLNKFFQPAEMDSQVFFARWKALGKPEQECQKIFPASHPMDSESSKAKILGFGMSVLPNIDPNPGNFVSAGILKLKTAQIGCLLRLEPNKQSNMYRMTLRSSNENAAKSLVALLFEQF